MKRLIFTLMTTAACLAGNAQGNAADSTIQQKILSRLHVGGYGEAVFSRNWYSDHVSRYSEPEAHKNDPSHGRFDIPHAVIYLGYDFGKGWSFSTEIEFEQENETEIYFAEEILIEHAYQKTVKATDRATMMNLMEGLNGYTLCSSIYSEKLSGDQFLVIPFRNGDSVQSSMDIGYITKKNNELSSMGKRFLDEVRRELEIRE